MRQELLAQDPIVDSKLHFDNLGGFLSYLEYLTSNKIKFNEIKADHDSDSLKNCHIGNSVLLVDKYVNCSIPSPDLEFLLESQGIVDYEAYLDPEYQFSHSICGSEEALSEIFSVNIRGDHFNPYIRYKSCAVSGIRSCGTLLDLVGLEVKVIKELSPSETFINESGKKDFIPGETSIHDNIFLDIVCTFPKIIDYYMINPDCRNKASYKLSKNGKKTSQRDIGSLNLIDRMNSCRKRFYMGLGSIFWVPEGNVFGMSSSLHTWSSEVPVLPNCHIHNIIPFFTYHKNRVWIPELVEDVFDKLSDVVGFVDVVTKKRSRIKQVGPECDRRPVKVTEEVKLVEKFILDQDRYNQLRLELSNRLKDHVNFSPCDWSTRSRPVDIDKVKELWSDIVYNEFGDLMDCHELLDVHVKWIPWYNKSKLLHALQYKVRPPVLDLDLFFKKCPDVVFGYDKVDTGKVLNYLNYQLEIAVKCSNTPDINRYESLLSKAFEIFDNYSESDILSWLQFLSTWVTDTRVYGFWKNLKRYLLDPDHKVLVEREICPLCGGSIADSGTKSQFCIIDYVMVRTRSKFMVYDVKGPPDGPGGLNGG